MPNDPHFPPRPDLVAKKWFTRIETAPNLDMLKHIGELLAKTDDVISDENRQVARDLFRARWRQIESSNSCSAKG